VTGEGRARRARRGCRRAPRHPRALVPAARPRWPVAAAAPTVRMRLAASQAPAAAAGSHRSQRRRPRPRPPVRRLRRPQLRAGQLRAPARLPLPPSAFDPAPSRRRRASCGRAPGRSPAREGRGAGRRGRWPGARRGGARVRARARAPPHAAAPRRARRRAAPALRGAARGKAHLCVLLHRHRAGGMPLAPRSTRGFFLRLPCRLGCGAGASSAKTRLNPRRAEARWPGAPGRRRFGARAAGPAAAAAARPAPRRADPTGAHGLDRREGARRAPPHLCCQRAQAFLLPPIARLEPPRRQQLGDERWWAVGGPRGAGSAGGVFARLGGTESPAATSPARLKGRQAHTSPFRPEQGRIAAPRCGCLVEAAAAQGKVRAGEGRRAGGPAAGPGAVRKRVSRKAGEGI
jgi:hypothetical protein